MVELGFGGSVVDSSAVVECVVGAEVVEVGSGVAS